jgi:hypothetical protein
MPSANAQDAKPMQTLAVGLCVVTSLSGFLGGAAGGWGLGAGSKGGGLGRLGRRCAIERSTQSSSFYFTGSQYTASSGNASASTGGFPPARACSSNSFAPYLLRRAAAGPA